MQILWYKIHIYYEYYAKSMRMLTEISCKAKVENIFNQFIDKLNLPYKFEIDNEFQISRGD